MCEAFKNWFEPSTRCRQLLRQHARVADRGHEVGVAVPPRHEVDMKVVEHAGASRAAEVDANVDPLRRVRLAQRHFRMPRQPHQVRLFGGRRDRQARDVPVRDDHQVTVVVRVQIQDGVTGGSADEDEIVARGISAGAEDTAVGAAARAGHVLQSPRSPKVFHGKVKS